MSTSVETVAPAARPRDAKHRAAKPRPHLPPGQDPGRRTRRDCPRCLLPGAGYLWTRRRLGWLVLVPFLVGLGVAAYYAQDVRRSSTRSPSSPSTRPGCASSGSPIGLAFVVWAFTVVTTYPMARPLGMNRLEKSLGATRRRTDLRAGRAAGGPEHAADDHPGALRGHGLRRRADRDVPEGVTEEDPWAGQDRVNVLLLGGDGGVGRDGHPHRQRDPAQHGHPDRQVGDVQPAAQHDERAVPRGQPAARRLPRRLQRGGRPGQLDAQRGLQGQVPALYPGILGESENEGADAIKQAVAGSLGTHVDYYLLINLLGFQQLVDAIGGVTVNINEPVAINGNTDLGIPPTGYLEPGPDQHLDGFHALWFSRGRWGSDDYERMLRQRCMVDAIIEEADPLNVLRRYQALAKAGEEILRTDIPRKLMPAFVDLALEGQGEEGEVDRLRLLRQVLLRRPRLHLDAVRRRQGARPEAGRPEGRPGHRGQGRGRLRLRPGGAEPRLSRSGSRAWHDARLTCVAAGVPDGQRALARRSPRRTTLAVPLRSSTYLLHAGDPHDHRAGDVVDAGRGDRDDDLDPVLVGSAWTRISASVFTRAVASGVDRGRRRSRRGSA